MRNAIILHGMPGKDEYYDDKYPSASNSHWIPWLQKQLLINGIKADTPEVPEAYNPQYNSFLKEVLRFEITPLTTLIGHSTGAGFWVKYLSENPDVFVDKVILVAPWINSDHKYDIDFFDFKIDPAIVNRSNEFIIFSSDNDSATVQSSVKVLVEKLHNISHHNFHHYGHFTLGSMKTSEFPELLNVIV